MKGDSTLKGKDVKKETRGDQRRKGQNTEKRRLVNQGTPTLISTYLCSGSKKADGVDTSSLRGRSAGRYRVCKVADWAELSEQLKKKICDLDQERDF
ncbi:MAG: hypothetical protein ACRDF4_05830 [Rhabdochlamydiaceae bacterium]